MRVQYGDFVNAKFCFRQYEFFRKRLYFDVCLSRVKCESRTVKIKIKIKIESSRGPAKLHPRLE